MFKNYSPDAANSDRSPPRYFLLLLSKPIVRLAYEF